MAIVWGAWNSTTRLRTGIEVTYSPTSITSATTSVTVTIKVYLQTYYASNETGSSTTWWISGAASASGNTDWNLGAMGYKLMGQTSHVVTLNYGSTQSKTYTGRTHSYFAYPGVETTASTTITIPARPYSVPTAPSSASIARNSDTSHTMTWARVASASAPVETTSIQRWDNITNTYATIAQITTDYTTSGNQSYTDNTTVANRQYRYRVEVSNSAGYSSFTYTDFIKTTPEAATSLVAAKTAANNIDLTWTVGDNFIGDSFDIYHDEVSDFSSANFLGNVSGASRTFTHATPDPVWPHYYLIRVKTTSGLVSTDRTSNAVQLVAPPNAPTPLSPATGSVKDATQSIDLTWQHNPVDTTPQRKKTMQYRVNGGAWTNAGTVTSADSTWNIPANFWTNGSVIEWQVATWGAATTGGGDGTGASPWSSISSITLSSKPTVTINSPADGSVHNGASFSVTWGYFDAEGTLQAEWYASLFDSTNGVPWTVLESRSGTTGTGTTFATAVQDGRSYVVQVQVRDSAGSLSDIDSAAFTVDYAPPPVPVGMVTWDEPNGVVLIEAAISAPGVGEVDPDYYRVWRSVDSGLTWSLAVAYVTIGAVATDHIPPLNSIVQYKIEAISVTPSSSMSEAVGIFTDNSEYNRVWLNFGANFGDSVFMSSNVSVGVASSRSKTLQQFAGRELPVEFSAVNRERTISVKGTLFTQRVSPDAWARSSSWDDIEDAVVNSTAPACLRDLYGHRWFVSTNAASWGGGAKKIHEVSFSCEEIDYHEPTEEEV